MGFSHISKIINVAKATQFYLLFVVSQLKQTVSEVSYKYSWANAKNCCSNKIPVGFSQLNINVEYHKALATFQSN